jgi:hypothetical protein
MHQKRPITEFLSALTLIITGTTFSHQLPAKTAPADTTLHQATIIDELSNLDLEEFRENGLMGSAPPHHDDDSWGQHHHHDINNLSGQKLQMNEFNV